MRFSSEKFKNLSKKEFTKVAEKYEWDHAGIYKLCRNDYPAILAEIEKDHFEKVLDAWCGPATIIQLLSEKFPDKQYVGIDLTPKMIEVAKKKKVKNAEFLVWDCENLPFDENTFDIIICSQSFHHYPNPQNFFKSVKKTLKPWGKLILRDMSLWKWLWRFVNYIEIPMLNLFWFWDVKIYTKKDIQDMCKKSGLLLEHFEYKKWFRLHAIIRKADV